MAALLPFDPTNWRATKQLKEQVAKARFLVVQFL
jgi:hypothetical protein